MFLGNKQSKFRSQQNLFQGNLCLKSILKVMGVLFPVFLDSLWTQKEENNITAKKQAIGV